MYVCVQLCVGVTSYLPCLFVCFSTFMAAANMATSLFLDFSLSVRECLYDFLFKFMSECV